MNAQIMNKQRFKEHIANTVISAENRSFSTMANATGSILDLFYLQNPGHNTYQESVYEKGGVDSLGELHKRSGKQKALDSMLDNLTNMTLIDEQYSAQFDLKKFIRNLK